MTNTHAQTDRQTQKDRQTDGQTGDRDIYLYNSWVGRCRFRQTSPQQEQQQRHVDGGGADVRTE